MYVSVEHSCMSVYTHGRLQQQTTATGSADNLQRRRFTRIQDVSRLFPHSVSHLQVLCAYPGGVSVPRAIFVESIQHGGVLMNRKRCQTYLQPMGTGVQVVPLHISFRIQHNGANSHKKLKLEVGLRQLLVPRELRKGGCIRRYIIISEEYMVRCLLHYDSTMISSLDEHVPELFDSNQLYIIGTLKFISPQCHTILC